jgi:hypothetical protein
LNEKESSVHMKIGFSVEVTGNADEASEVYRLNQQIERDLLNPLTNKMAPARIASSRGLKGVDMPTLSDISPDDYEVSHLRSTFDGLTRGEVFEYLSDKRKGQLQTDFVHDWLDADDRESAVFKLIDYGDMLDLSSRLEGSWLRFLESRFALDTQGAMVEEGFQNFVEQNQ